MRICKKCFEPDTRPGQVFNEEGVCTPCQVQDTKISPEEWKERRIELMDVVDWARKKRSRGGYDCVIGVSGGKDSTCLALFAREIGMNPLLVCCTYPPQQFTNLGAYDLSNLVSLGFDLITVNIAPEVMKTAIRHSFLKFANWCKPSEMALYSSIPRIALSHGIALACAGENPFLTFGNECGSMDGDASNIFTMNTLDGGDLTPYLEDGNTTENMLLFKFPDKEKWADKTLRMIYLGYYIKDWSLTNNGKKAIKNGLKVRTGIEADPARTGAYHNHTFLDEDFVIVNNFLKYLKFGFGQASQQISDDIRHGILRREDMVDFVRKYDGCCDIEYIRRFIEYIEITEETFWEVANKARNRDIWEKVDQNWQLKVIPD